MMKLYCEECFYCCLEGNEEKGFYFWCDKEEKKINFLKDYCIVEKEKDK